MSTGFEQPVAEPSVWDWERLEALSEDDLLIGIGTAFVSPAESFSAIARNYAGLEPFTQFSYAGLAGDFSVDLLALGKRGVGEALARIDARTREEICRLLRSKSDLRDLVASIAAVLVGCVLFHGIPVVLVALYLARYGGKKFCEAQPAGVAPAPA